MVETETIFTVRYAETDQMGIAHHSNYAVWFEAGRTDFFQNLGMTISQIEELGILLPLSHIDCNFLNPAKYEDKVAVKTKIKEMTCVRIEFSYQVVNGSDGRIHATGSTSHAWTDKAVKPLNVKKKLPELYNNLLKSLK